MPVLLHSARPKVADARVKIMLNRTNRTLSANFNGLNLGTRSLAKVAGYHGRQALRARHAFALHADSMWQGDRIRMIGWPSLIGPPSSFPAPSSPADVAWPRAVTAAWQRVELVAEAPQAERPIVAHDPGPRSSQLRAQGLSPASCSDRPAGSRGSLVDASRSKQAAGRATQATCRLPLTPSAIPIALGG